MILEKVMVVAKVTMTTIVTIFTHQIGHTATCTHHHATGITTLHLVLLEDQVGMEVVVVVVVVVDPRVTEVMELPHHTIIKE